jgi:shikimate kinase
LAKLRANIQAQFGGLLTTPRRMAKRNFLVEGGSGTGKSSVCRELRRRGYRAVDGDNEIAYQGDPKTGLPVEGSGRYEYHIWDVDKVREIAAGNEEEIVFFCGGSRNFGKFLTLFDKVFVLDVDIETLRRRLADREPTTGVATTSRRRSFFAFMPPGQVAPTASSSAPRAHSPKLST